MKHKRFIFILLMAVLCAAFAAVPAIAQADEQEFETLRDSDLTPSAPVDSAETPRPASPVKKKTEGPRVTVKIYDSNPPTPEQLAMRRKKIEEAYRRVAVQKARRTQEQKRQAIPVD